MRSAYLLKLTLFVVACRLLAGAQVSTGLPPYGSFSGGPDVINLGNLNVHFGPIPFSSKPGRMPFFYNLSLDSSVWFPAGASGSQHWQAVGDWGWRDQSEVLTGFLSYQTTLHSILCGSKPNLMHGVDHTTSNWVYHDRLGGLHPFGGSTDFFTGQCGGSPTSFTNSALDGSGYTLNANGSAGTVVSRDGLSGNPPVNQGFGTATATDRNGNQVSVAYNGSTHTSTFSDTLGTTVLTTTGGAPNPLVYTYTDSSDTQRSISINYTAYTVQTNFGCSGISEYGPTANIYLVSSIGFPDGSSFSFTYEPTPGFGGSVTGRVQSITLRTGATITYAYTGGGNGIECSDGSTAGLTRTTSDGTTTYTRSGAGTAWTTTVTDAQNNQTVINFQTATASGTTVTNFYETHRTVNQGASTVLLKTDTCYNGSAPDCTGIAISLPLTEIKKYATLNNGQESLNDAFLNSLGLTTQVNEYDFGSPSPGPVLRKTLISYAALGNGIVSFPSSITVQDGGGNQQAQTTFGYDETTAAPTSGVPQHTAISGSRGNQTSINQWLNTTNTNLTTTLTYDDTGNVLTSTDPGGHQTQFSYADNFADGINRTSLAYVTQVTMPDTNSPNLAHHVMKAQYDANTGLPVKIWDQNNNFTTFAYDLLLRPLQINSPDGGQTSITYQTTTQTAPTK